VEASLDGIPDIGNLNIGRKKNVPKIIDGYKAMLAAGKIEDDWVKETLPRMVKNMEIWGALMRAADVPDKRSRTMLKDAKEFKKIAASGDYDGAVKAFQKYLDDLPEFGPGGNGKIDLENPMLPPMSR